MADRYSPNSRAETRAVVDFVSKLAMSSVQPPLAVSPGAAAIAEAIGQDMAKEAAFGLGAAVKGMGNMLRGGVRGGVGKLVNPGQGPGAVTKIRQGFQEMGAHMTDLGNRAQGIKPATGMSQRSQIMKMHGEQNSVPRQPLVQPKPMQAQGLTQNVPAPTPNANVNTSSSASPWAAKPEPEKPSFLQKTKLFDEQGNFRKGRALGMAALAGGGVLTYGAAKEGLNYMNEHQPNGNYNLGGNQLPMGVNQYGVPQHGTPMY